MRASPGVLPVYAPEPIVQGALRRQSLQAAHIMAAATTPLRMAVHIPVL
jgi:hypothetical protein